MKRTGKKLTQKRLKELLSYDPATGAFVWKQSNSNVAPVGAIAGSLHHTGYVYIGVCGKLYNASRLAFLYMAGYLPEHEVDHKDRNRKNNKWLNLRHVSHSCNSKNRSIHKNNSSGVPGVSYHSTIKKWCAGIKINSRQIHIGCFAVKCDAVLARWGAEKEYGFKRCQEKSPAYLYLKERGIV